MKKFKLFLCIMILYMTSTMQFQANAQGFCGWNSAYDNQLQDPNYVEYIQSMLEDSETAAKGIEESGSIMEVEIPIIFHIVHKGTSVPNGDNIAYSDVLSAFNRLNQDFEGTGISFCLAKRDEMGNQLDDNPNNSIAEPGVVRVDGSVFPEYITSGISINSSLEYNIKTLGPQFNNYSYLNVWVVSDIIGSDTNGQVQGVGYFPHTTVPEIDGVMMRHSIFNLATNRVFTHEVGHYLGLFHTFQGDDYDIPDTPPGCPSATAPFPLSDQIEDTQPHMRSPSGSCLSGDNICSPIDENGANTTYDQLENITNNHMDYSLESCRVNFTNGQILSMLATIESQRKGLTHSLGCQFGCDPIFTVDFESNPENPIANDVNGENGEEATFISLFGGTNYKWYIDGVLQDKENQDIDVVFDSPGDHVVCIRADDGNCEIEICKTVRVFLGGLCYDPTLDPCELLLNGDFQQHVEDEFPGNNSIIVDLHNFMVPFYEPAYDKICNWHNILGTPTLSENQNQKFIVLSDNMPAGNFSLKTLPNYDVFVSASDIPFIDGQTYQLTFDYYTFYSNTTSPDTPNYKLLKILLSHDEDLGEDINLTNLENIEWGSSQGGDYENAVFNKFDDFTFTYDESMGKRLVFVPNGSIVTTATASIAITNISITKCDFCDAQPNFSYAQSACNTFTLTGNNQNPDAPGFVSWSIDGITLPQFTGANDIEDLTFPFEGEYEVCMNITCPNGITNQDCQTIDVTGEFLGVDCHPCQNPTVVNAEAQRCGKESNEYVINNFAITVPKGYSTCNGQVFSQSFNGDILLNDYVIDNTGATEDVIYLSFTFLAEDADTENFGALFAVCSPDGLSTECFRIQIDDPQTCNECSDDQSLVSNMSVNCIDIDPNDNVFMYAGSFTIDVPQGYQFCGSSSPNAGITVDAVNANTNGSYNIGYTISTNNDGHFNNSLTLCFNDPISGIKYCFDIDISVLNPCMPDDDNCEIDIPPYTISCTEVKDGLATFIFSYSLHLPQYVMDGYEFCTTDPITGRHLVTDRATITLGDTEIQVEPTIGVNAYIFAVELEIPCADLAINATSELIVKLCSETDMICVDLDFNLMCPDCDSVGGKRSIKEMIDEYSIIPNPTHQMFNIKAPASESIQSYQIYDTTGQLEMSGSLIGGDNIINFDSRNNGVYFVKIINGEEITTKRILIIK